MQQRRIRVIVNPSARSSRGPRALGGLRAHATPGVLIEWIESRSAGHLQDLVAAAQADELAALGLAGGDGTVTLALNALGDGPDRTPQRVPLGLLPIGSGNDFARDVGVPDGAGAAFATLLGGVPRPVDVGLWCPAADAAGPRSRRFCCVGSVGLDELALRTIHGSRWPRSQALNVYAALRALFAYRPRAARLSWDGGSYVGELMFAAVTNTRSYGGGFRVCPDARVDDGRLDLCIVKAGARLDLIRQFPRILRGTHGGSPDVILARSPWVRIDVPDGDPPLRLCIDGELPEGVVPVELSAQPAGVQVLVPPLSAQAAAEGSHAA